MKKIFPLFLVPFALLSCDEEYTKGACEKKVSDYQYTADTILVTSYSCRDVNDEAACMSENEKIESYFHEGKSCEEIGYTFLTKNGSYSAGDGNLDTAGAGGYFITQE